jgi:hypothetical protein
MPILRPQPGGKIHGTLCGNPCPWVGLTSEADPCAQALLLASHSLRYVDDSFVYRCVLVLLRFWFVCCTAWSPCYLICGRCMFGLFVSLPLGLGHRRGLSAGKVSRKDGTHVHTTDVGFYSHSQLCFRAAVCSHISHLLFSLFCSFLFIYLFIFVSFVFTCGSLGGHLWVTCAAIGA